MQDCLHDVVADTFDQAGRERGVVGQIDGIKEFDFASLNAVGQLKTADRENFKLTGA